VCTKMCTNSSVAGSGLGLRAGTKLGTVADRADMAELSGPLRVDYGDSGAA
jgi:hypothetical protein